MSHLSFLNDEEIRYICSVIPGHHAIDYFMANHKEFVKIRPGFRMNKASLAKLDIGNLLYRYRNRGFIEFFIEKIVGDWLDQIKEHLEKCINDGDSKEASIINTMPLSFFAENVRIYFKLVNEKYSDETLLMLEPAVKKLKESSEKIDFQEKELESKENSISELRDKLEDDRVHVESMRQRLVQAEGSSKQLRIKDREVETLKIEIEKKTGEIERLYKKSENQKKDIDELNLELTRTTKEMLLREEQVRADVERQSNDKKRTLVMQAKPKRPVDMDEFTDHLIYNFESLGIVQSEAYIPLLKTHLSHILFEGIPIVVNRLAGLTLMRCVSNSIVGNPDVETLCFSEGLSIGEIENFMLSAGRILCLDNFIGNFNEAALIPLFDKHKGQIVFLTYCYDRMLKYVSNEFLRYVLNLNVNRVTVFNASTELTEDPSIIEEAEYALKMPRTDNRFSPLLREILGELGYTKGVTEYLCATIANENDLCRKLAFDILPYCVDVLQIAPFSISERLVKYSDTNGRCPYKDLFRRWFA